MKQLTQKQAIAFAENKLYEGMTSRQIAEFQLMQERLCMPLEVFQKALQESLGRPVFTHEMATRYNDLVKELYGEKEPPTLEDIINLIPEEKRILVLT